MQWIRDRHAASSRVLEVRPGVVTRTRAPIKSKLPLSLRLFREPTVNLVLVQITGNAQRDIAAIDEMQQLFPEAKLYLVGN